MDIVSLVQTKAFAGQDGLILSLVWAASFLSFMYAPTSGMGSLLMWLTPVVVVWRMIAFRNYALDGVMSYGKALIYCLYVFFFASVVFALVQYVFLRFIDEGQMNNFLIESFNQSAPVLKQQGNTQQDINAMTGMFVSLSPLNKAFIFMMTNFLTGLFLSFPLALIGRRTQAPTKRKEIR